MIALQTELRDVERKITNTVNLMVETGSAAFKDKLNELEQSKEKLLYELGEAEALLSQESFSEEKIRKLFQAAEQQLKNGTLANRRMVIDQYVNKVVVYKEKIEIYLNVFNDYEVKKTIEQ